MHTEGIQLVQKGEGQLTHSEVNSGTVTGYSLHASTKLVNDNTKKGVYNSLCKYAEWVGELILNSQIA